MMKYIIDFFGWVITLVVYAFINVVTLICKGCFTSYGTVFNKIKFMNGSYRKLTPSSCVDGLFKSEDVAPKNPKHHLELILKNYIEE